MATRLLLVRHGAINWSGKIGAPDDGLNEAGRSQAQATARRLVGLKPVALYSSTMRRAIETAEIIAGVNGLEVLPEQRLREWYAGEWEGLPEEQVRVKYPELWARLDSDWSFVMPGGETVDDVYRRVLEAARQIVAVHPEGNVVLVGHGGSLSYLIGQVLGMDPDMQARGYHRGRDPFVLDNCSLSVVEFRDTHPVVICLNDTCHLETLA